MPDWLKPPKGVETRILLFVLTESVPCERARDAEGAAPFAVQIEPERP